MCLWEDWSEWKSRAENWNTNPSSAYNTVAPCLPLWQGMCCSVCCLWRAGVTYLPPLWVSLDTSGRWVAQLTKTHPAHLTRAEPNAFAGAWLVAKHLRCCLGANSSTYLCSQWGDATGRAGSLLLLPFISHPSLNVHLCFNFFNCWTWTVGYV